MRGSWLLFVVCLFSIFIFSCGGGDGDIVENTNDTDDTTTTCIVSGAVFVTGTDDPISGVLVKIGSISDTTDNSGKFELNDVPVGSQTITSFKSDFEGTAETIECKSGVNTHNIYMTFSILTTAVSGTVKYPDGYPVMGATVTIGEMEQTTDSEGGYQFPTVPQGDITITVVHPDCADLIYESSIYLSNNSRIYNVELEHCYVYDSNTNMMWQKFNSGNGYIDEAHTTCSNLEIEGYDDWRVPSIKELLSIIDFGISSRIDTKIFSGGIEDTLSSTPWDKDPSYYWAISNLSSDYLAYHGWKRGFIRCVRGDNLPASNFIENGDGSIFDLSTGLMWENFVNWPVKYQEALNYCEGLNLGGYSDWRLPAIQELITIIDYGTSEPALDLNYFSEEFINYPDINNFWSATQSSEARSPWVASLYNGDILKQDYASDITDLDNCICVRGIQH